LQVTDSQSPAFYYSEAMVVTNGLGNEGQKYAQISEEFEDPSYHSGKALFQDIWTNRTFVSKVVDGDVLLTDKVTNQG